MIRNVRHPQILGGVSFPPEVLNAIAENRLVIFAGAGVSKGDPSALPDFLELATELARGSGKTPLDPLDQFLGTLPNQNNLRQRAADLTDTGSPHNALHESLIRTFGGLSRIRVVTTNYDKMFELAALALYAEAPTTFSAPALPVGEKFNGIVHVHGYVEHPNGIVLTDSHFGEAYLSEGWARRFLLSMFQSGYTVLFVGYRHEDTMLRYLARALPVGSDTLRYALVGSDELADKWTSLGISTLQYEPDGKHTVLYAAVEALANYAQRRPSEWKYQLEQLASQPPTGSPEDENLVRSVLSSAPHFRFFSGEEIHEDWYRWFIKNDCFQPLYDQETPDELSGEVSDWLTKNLLQSRPQDALLLLASFPKPVKPWFWERLATRSIQIKVDRFFLQVVNLLLQWQPTQPSSMNRYKPIAERLAKISEVAVLLAVFERAIKCDVSLSIREQKQSSESPIPPINAQLSEPIDSYTLGEIHGYLKPFYSSHAEAILAVVERSLLARQLSMNTWDARLWTQGDQDSLNVDEIIPLEQHGDPEYIDVLINIARESLEHLGIHRPYAAINWIDTRARSESKLLRRLAVHSIGSLSELDFDQKIAKLLDLGLHEPAHNHEAHVLLQAHFGSADTETQDKVIASITSYKQNTTFEKDPVLPGLQTQLVWLNELALANPQCINLKRAIDDIQQQHPDMKAVEYTVPNHRIQFIGVNHQSPYSAEQLLAQDGLDFDKVLSFRSCNSPFSGGPSISGLENAISEAARQNLDWALNFTDYLVEKNLWNSNYFACLLREMRNWPKKEPDANRLLQLLSNSDAQSNFPREMTDILLQFVRGESTEYFCRIVDKTDAVAREVFSSEKAKQEASVSNNINSHTSSTNPIEGRITEYWVHALSHRINKCGSTGLDTVSRTELEALVDRDSSAFNLAVPVLTQQLDFLNAVDNNWVKEKLIPLFIGADINTTQLAWNGYLHSKGPSQELFSLLEPAFEHALSNINTMFPVDNGARFLEFLAASVVWILKHPQDIWLPRIIDNTSDSNRTVFTGYLCRMIKNLDSLEREKTWSSWLRPYWERRSEGNPALISSGEFNELLNLLPHLSEEYPAAVDLLNESPDTAELSGYFPFYFSDKNDLINAHPTATARLISGLLTRRHTEGFFSELEDQILAPLRAVRSRIDSEVLTPLNEVLLENGFDPI